MKDIYDIYFDHIEPQLAKVSHYGWFRLLSGSISLLFALMDFVLGFRHFFWTQLGLSLLRPFYRQHQLYFHGFDIGASRCRFFRIFSRIAAPPGDKGDTSNDS